MPPSSTPPSPPASNSGGSVAPAGENTYALGAAVDVTATLESGYHLEYWEGDLPAGYDANTTTLTVYMDAPKELTAHFGTNVTRVLELTRHRPR